MNQCNFRISLCILCLVVSLFGLSQLGSEAWGQEHGKKAKLHYGSQTRAVKWTKVTWSGKPYRQGLPTACGAQYSG